MTERLNARIDAELARKVRYLRGRTRKTTTQVVKASIEAYYEQLSAGQPVAELLAHFVGSAQGDPELSSNYKASLSNSLRRKVSR
jgi:hypothetical protein